MNIDRAPSGAREYPQHFPQRPSKMQWLVLQSSKQEECWWGRCLSVFLIHCGGPLIFPQPICWKLDMDPAHHKPCGLKNQEVSEAITGLAPCSFVPLSHMAPQTPRSQGARRCEFSMLLNKYRAVGRDDPLMLSQVFAWQWGLLEKGDEHVVTPN